MDALLKGYRRFRKRGWVQQRKRWEELRQGQQPKALVVACSDSRVDPALLFDAAPGEIFSVRNVANLIPPMEQGLSHGATAALEYAVTVLGVKHLIVMGHASCGGVGASLGRMFVEAEPGHGAYVRTWVRLLDEARERVVAAHGDGPEAQHALELEGVRVSLDNLRTYPFIAEREAAGTLQLWGAYFSIEDGQLHMLGKDGDFTPVKNKRFLFF